MDDIKYSSCCGAAAGDFEDVGICPECLEYCTWMNDEDYEQEQKDTARTLQQDEQIAQ